MITLKPGRYKLLGGPRGEYALHSMDRQQRTADGRHYFANATGRYTDRWTVLASLRIRPGHRATFYGVIGAAERVWRY